MPGLQWLYTPQGSPAPPCCGTARGERGEGREGDRWKLLTVGWAAVSQGSRVVRGLQTHTWGAEGIRVDLDFDTCQDTLTGVKVLEGRRPRQEAP